MQLKLVYIIAVNEVRTKMLDRATGKYYHLY